MFRGERHISKRQTARDTPDTTAGGGVGVLVWRGVGVVGGAVRLRCGASVKGRQRYSVSGCALGATLGPLESLLSRHNVG